MLRASPKRPVGTHNISDKCSLLRPYLLFSKWPSGFNLASFVHRSLAIWGDANGSYFQRRVRCTDFRFVIQCARSDRLAGIDRYCSFRWIWSRKGSHCNYDDDNYYNKKIKRKIRREKISFLLIYIKMYRYSSCLTIFHLSGRNIALLSIQQPLTFRKAFV